MSSSYSSLDWVLSHWAHITLRRFTSVYMYFVLFVSCIMCHVTVKHGEVDLMGLKPSLRPYLPSVLRHCWLGNLTSVKTVPNVTYNVSGGS